MAAKSLTEAIRKAMMIGPMAEFETRCAGEIKDMLAHRLASYQLMVRRAGGPDAEMKDRLALEVFEYLMMPEAPKTQPVEQQFAFNTKEKK